MARGPNGLAAAERPFGAHVCDRIPDLRRRDGPAPDVIAGSVDSGFLVFSGHGTARDYLIGFLPPTPATRSAVSRWSRC